MRRFIFIILALLIALANGRAQPSTYPLYEIVFGNQIVNRDSVRVDTMFGSPTYGEMFAKGYFQIIFSYHVISLDSVRADSILFVGIDGIDSSYTSVSSAFSAIEDKYGSFTFLKKYPQIGDSSLSTSNEFFLTFDSYVNVDSALVDLRTVPLVEAYFHSKPAALSTIPNDLGMVPGASSSSVFGDPGWPADFHQLGWHWALYKIKCPMAWEITQGRASAPFVYILDGDKWSGLVTNPDMTNFVQIQAATSDKGIQSLSEMGDHGMNCMSTAIAAANNGYPMVGSAPNSKGIGINPGTNYRDIDVDGVKGNGTTLADVIYIASGAPDDYDYMIDHGTVVLWAGGNWMRTYAGIDYPQQDNAYGTGGVRTIDDNPKHDIPYITVGGSRDGTWTGCGGGTIDGTIRGTGNIERGAERVNEWLTWPAGQEKYDQTSDYSERALQKSHAFMDILAPGQELLDGDGAGLGIVSGTSLSAPQVAGVVALMKSVDRWLGVSLDGNKMPVTGSDVQTRAHSILTFTADKIADVDRFTTNPGNGHPVAQGYPSSTSDPVYTSGILDSRYANPGITTPWHYDYNTDATFTDNDVVTYSGVEHHLHRSWAQRNGFGRVNAYRALAQTLPWKGAHSYTSSSSDLFAGDTSKNENNQYLMHFGAWKDGGNKVLDSGGNIIPHQEETSPFIAWPHYNQGETLINSGDGTTATVLTVGESPSSGDKDILAIDGLVRQTDATEHANKITATSNGKILITGYLEDVEITGDTTKVDDLIIYSGNAYGYSKVTVNSGDVSEIYGVVHLQGHGQYVVNGGNLTIQPGGEIDMDGNKDFEIVSGTVYMEASSKIASSAKQVIVDDGATLEIQGALPVDILCKLHVMSGGQVTIDGGAHLRLDKFLIDQNGLLTCAAGGTLTLNQNIYNSCNGKIEFNGTSGSRCTLTGGLSTCGEVSQTAGIIVTGKTNSVDAVNATQLKMVYTDVSDVLIKVVDAKKYPFSNDNFSANSSFCPPGGCSPFIGVPFPMTLLSILNTSLSYTAWNGYLLRTYVASCHFFDEAPAYGGSLSSPTGIFVQNQQKYQISGSYLYNLFVGSWAMHCTNCLYSGNTIGQDASSTAGGVWTGIIEQASSGIYCSNLIKNTVFGITAINDVKGSLFDNTITTNTGWCLSAQSGGEYDLRGNSLSDYYHAGIYSHGAKNNISLRNVWPGKGSTFDYEYGKNSLMGNTGSMDLYMGKDANNGDFTVDCGKNKFGPSSMYNISGPTDYSIAVDGNEWQAPLSTHAVRPDGVIMTGTPIDESETADASCGAPEVAPICTESTTNAGDSYPSCAAWAALDSSSSDLRTYFWNANGMVLSDTLSGAGRLVKARDLFWAATLIDSSTIYLPIAVNTLRTVLGDGPGDLKSGILMLKGEVHELMGNIDSAVAAYTDVITNYHQYSDSIYALWNLQRLSYASDTLYSSAFDSSQGAYTIRVYNDLLAMLDTAVAHSVDTSCAFFPHDSLNPYNLTGQWQSTMLDYYIQIVGGSTLAAAAQDTDIANIMNHWYGDSVSISGYGYDYRYYNYIIPIVESVYGGGLGGSANTLIGNYYGYVITETQGDYLYEISHLVDSLSSGYVDTCTFVSNLAGIESDILTNMTDDMRVLPLSVLSAVWSSYYYWSNQFTDPPPVSTIGQLTVVALQGAIVGGVYCSAAPGLGVGLLSYTHSGAIPADIEVAMCAAITSAQFSASFARGFLPGNWVGSGFTPTTLGTP